MFIFHTYAKLPEGMGEREFPKMKKCPKNNVDITMENEPPMTSWELFIQTIYGDLFGGGLWHCYTHIT